MKQAELTTEPVAETSNKTGDSTFVWLSLIPIALLVYLGWHHIAPRLATTPDPALLKMLFLDWSVGSCVPESLEQIRYLLFIATVPIAFAALLMLQPILAKRIKLKLGYRIPVIIALAVQIGLIIVAHKHIRPDLVLKPTLHFIGFGALITGIGLGLLWALRRLEGNLNKQAPIAHLLTFRTLPVLIAIAFSAIQLLPSLTVDMVHAHTGNIGFTTYAMGEFSAVLNGRTILVDFFPQYQNLSPYLLCPVFKALGASATGFSLMMAGLSLVGMLCIYGTFRSCITSYWGALLLYLPFCSIAVWPIDICPNGYPFTTFTYYAVGPLRYFGPWLVMFLCAKYFLKPSLPRLLLLAIAASLVAMNNLDFGVPAYVGALCAVVLTSASGFRPTRESWQNMAVFLGAILVCLGLFSMFTYLRSGFLPKWAQVFEFQRIFVHYGFNMVPMPKRGIHWLFCATFLAAIIRGAWIHWTNHDPRKDHTIRLRTGLLVFTGIFGAGSFFYYVGRSHPFTLMLMYAGWAFAFLLLVSEQIQALRALPAYPSKWNWLPYVLPGLVIGGVYLLLCGTLVKTPSLRSQRKRLAYDNVEFNLSFKKAVAFLKQQCQPGERVVIIDDLGHTLANAAGIQNVYPYTGIVSPLIKPQISFMLEQMRRNGWPRAYVGLMREYGATGALDTALYGQFKEALFKERYRLSTPAGASPYYECLSRDENAVMEEERSTSVQK